MPEQIPSSFSLSQRGHSKSPALSLPRRGHNTIGERVELQRLPVDQKAAATMDWGAANDAQKSSSGVHGSPDCYGDLQPRIAGSWNRYPKELQPASLGAADDERRPASGYGGGAAMERGRVQFCYELVVGGAATGAQRTPGMRPPPWELRPS
ncbi:hypothetical protein ACQJBY_071738 [Aegilops geniculata]